MAQSTVEINEEKAEAEGEGAAPASGEYFSYEAFGVRFFEHAISPERIHGALSELVGKAIEFGPVAVGPARLAQITASGSIGEVTVTRCPSEDMVVTHQLVIPGNLDLIVRLAGRDYHFYAEMEATLTLTARAAEPLHVIIDVAPPSTKDVEVAVRAKDWRSRVLRTAANVDGQLRRFVTRYITREIEKPYIRRIREIDIAAHIGRAWD